MPKIVDKEAFKKALAHQAFAIFIETGIANFSLSAFLKQQGMAKGKFYHYFDSRETLIFESIEIAFDELIDEAEKNICWQDGLADKLIATYDFFLAESSEEAFLQKLSFVNEVNHLYTQSDNAEIRRFNEKASRIAIEVIHSIFEDEIIKQRIRPEAIELV